MKKSLLLAAVAALAIMRPVTQDLKAIFRRTCGACHNGQLATAPKKDDHAAWEPRLAKGMTTLVLHAIDGFNAMPPTACAPTAMPKTSRQPSDGWRSSRSLLSFTLSRNWIS